MATLALITARGGSKRIPEKNSKEVQDIDNESDWKSAEMKDQLIKSVDIIDGGYGRLKNNLVPVSRCIPFAYPTVHREVA